MKDIFDFINLILAFGVVISLLLGFILLIGAIFEAFVRLANRQNSDPDTLAKGWLSGVFAIVVLGVSIGIYALLRKWGM